MSGIFGVVSHDDCVLDLYHGTDYHLHMGQERAGLVVLGKNFQREIHKLGKEQFQGKFEHVLKEMQGNKGLGVISNVRESQPLIHGSRLGRFALVMLGLISNLPLLAERLRSQRHVFSEMSDGQINSVELAAKLISQGDDYVSGINYFFDQIAGSASLLLLTEEGEIYAARDRYGRTPLAIGVKPNSVAVASESCAFPNLGYRVEKLLAPDEIVLITNQGVKTIQPGQSERLQVCAFLGIYTSFPASVPFGPDEVEIIRERCGAALARRDDVIADLVAGVPDSGTAHAIGYATARGISYRRPLVKYSPSYGRSYTPASQTERDLIARMKLIAIPGVALGQKIILCEDSVVRGTQLKNETIRKLWDAGAKEIHLRPACPPLMFPCPFLLSTRSIHELAARRSIRALEKRDIEDVSAYLDATSPQYQQMVEGVRQYLGVTSLKYQLLEDMIEAVGLPEDQLCLYCWRGY